jgi:hypothetical protein
MVFLIFLKKVVVIVVVGECSRESGFVEVTASNAPACLFDLGECGSEIEMHYDREVT